MPVVWDEVEKEGVDGELSRSQDRTGRKELSKLDETSKWWSETGLQVNVKRTGETRPRPKKR